MPTISVDPKDFQGLLGFELSDQELERYLDLVKGEYKGRDEDGNYRIELNDTNRPDLWSGEGIARQIRAANGRRRDYPFFTGKSVAEIKVDASIRTVRPYVAAFIVRGITISDSSLTQIIQTQEKLAENFGRKRKDIAIGIYNVDKIRFPIHYQGKAPKKHSYTPLGFDEPMSLADILEKHPKGIEYRWILEGMDKVPLLMDSAGLTLSMPPIINSRELGEVVPGDCNLFVEATGTNLNQVMMAINILACDLADRGGRIERVRTLYPYSTSLGNKVDSPVHLDQEMAVPLEDFGRLLGVPIEWVEVDTMLERYGCDVRLQDGQAIVKPPPTRADYLHQADVVEDFAIARGYETFEPQMPRDFTTGRFCALSVCEDKIRDLMIGLGFEELISNILFSKELLRNKMNLPDEPLVEIQNVMNENYCALRDSILPCLLLAESRSATAAYPHRLFELGDVARFDLSRDCGSQTLLNHAALIAHQKANLSELHADLDFLFGMLEVEYRLASQDHPSFLPGRSARIVVLEQEVGWLGEIHPEVLERFEIGMPIVGFEMTLDSWV